MLHEGVQLSRISEPEDLVAAVPGVVYRATPLRPGPFEASLTTFGLAEFALQTGHATPHLAFAKAGPGKAAVKLPLENAETLVLNGLAVRPRTVALYGGGAELLRANPRDSRHAVLVLPMDRAEALLCPSPASPLLHSGAQGLLVLLCHILVVVPSVCLQAARTSRQGSDETDGEAAANGADGVWHVALRPDGRRRAAGSLRVAQVPRAAGG
jgi:hypothetical protein